MTISGSKTNKLTKRDLIRALQTKGFSYREGKFLTDTLLGVMVKALQSRQSVRLPFGTLRVIRNPRPVRILTFGTIVERYKRRYRVVLEPGEDDADSGWDVQ